MTKATLTETQQSAHVRLDLAQRQHELIEQQLSQCLERLSTLEGGTEPHLRQSQIALELRSQLTTLKQQISGLTEEAKGEAQRQAEAKAAADALRSQQEAQLATTNEKLNGLCSDIAAQVEALRGSLSELVEMAELSCELSDQLKQQPFWHRSVLTYSILRLPQVEKANGVWQIRSDGREPLSSFKRQ